MSVSESLLRKAKLWTEEPFDLATRQAANQLIEQGGEALEDAFYRDLDFGTGGLRGIMGVGTNRINKYTLGMATQGLSNYLKSQFSGKIKVAIAHDCRNNSQRFAKEVASVFAGNGIEVFLFPELRPTPELSFAIRHLGCQSGIVITASHNPPEYNGYKVYWNDGGQLVPPHDKAVIEEVRKVRIKDIAFDDKSPNIHKIEPSVDEAYLREVQAQSLQNAGKADTQVVFTSIHGTSITLLPKALENAGFSQVHIVEEQSTPSGDFPTVQSPNPEEAEALAIAVAQAEERKADIVIGTDPDADRVGIAVRDKAGKMRLLNGNQAATALIYYILDQKKKSGQLLPNHFIARTVVTTELIDRIAVDFGVDSKLCLTGFKWIADLIRKHEGKAQFLVGGEESYGYMIGDFVRDKDAITSAVLLAEIAAYAKAEGSSFLEYLIGIYQRYGFYLEDLVSITRKGKSGAEEIAALMQSFRLSPPAVLGGEKVVKVLDFQTGLKRDILSGQEEKIDMPRSNVIQFVTDNGSRITARPSGTEPKIKYYFSVWQKLESAEKFDSVQAQLQRRIAQIKADFN